LSKPQGKPEKESIAEIFDKRQTQVDQVKKIVDSAVSSGSLQKAIALFGRGLDPRWVYMLRSLTPADLASVDAAKKKLGIG